MWLVLLAACAREAPPLPATCDAGSRAWVHRAMPLLWGRRPHGTAEVEMWAAAADELGRDAVIEAMAADPAYLDHWSDVLLDTLRVDRSGDRAAGSCYSVPIRTTHDGAVARAIAATPADVAGAEAAPFNMADVVRSALVADQLSVVWRAHLYAQLQTPLVGANVGPVELEESRRVAFGEAFFATYLHRDLDCLPCHNSGGSVSPASPIPGAVEAGLLGAATGRPADEAYQPLRYSGQAEGSAQPWGMSAACGLIVPPDDTSDPLGVSGYFIEELGTAGSVWHIERALWAGTEALAASGYTPDAVSAEAGFAHLVARSIADAVWAEATGHPLTLSHHLPRNDAQRDRLWALADTLAESRFSLQALLAAVATDPYFNTGLTETCGARADGLAPIFDPFEEANGPGDVVGRHGARVLIRSAHDALGWPTAARFPALGDPMQSLQVDLGAYVRGAQPGFTGTDFQSLLAYEAAYGSCAPPTSEEAGDGCAETPAVAGCGNCTCEARVCADDPYCCAVQWDAECVDSCAGDCGGGAVTGDVVDQLLAQALAEQRTVGDVAAALKDRILSDSQIDEESVLIEALVEAPLAETVTDPDSLDRGLRLLCGAWLRSPDAMLRLERAAPSPVPALALDVADDCARLESLLPMACPVSP